MPIFDFLRALGGGQQMPRTETPQAQPVQADAMGGGFGQRWNRFMDNNPAFLPAIGDVLRGDSPNSSLAMGEVTRERRRKQQEEQAAQNKTKAWLLSQGVSEAEVDAAIAAGQVGDYFGPKKPRNLVNAGDGQLYDPDSGEWITAPGGGKNSEYDQRAKMAEEFGLAPDDPAYRQFILTGKFPREDQAPLTAVDKKAILEADEMVFANEQAVEQLKSAISEPSGPGSSLNDRAGSGALARTESWLARNDPTGILSGVGAVDTERGAATTELDNVVIGQALGTLKSIFGSAPTEGERRILVELQASVDKTPAERKTIIERGIRLAERRLAFNKQKASELRGGEYYKPDGNGTTIPAPDSEGWQDMGGGVRMRQIGP